MGRCSAFDELVENSGLWKLETVGDAYIAAGGLFSGGSHDGGPSATYDSKLVLRSNLDATFKAASKMLVSVCTTILRFSVCTSCPGSQDVLRKFRERTGLDLHMRIGIHVGTVAHGVIGTFSPRFCE